MIRSKNIRHNKNVLSGQNTTDELVIRPIIRRRYQSNKGTMLLEFDSKAKGQKTFIHE